MIMTLYVEPAEIRAWLGVNKYSDEFLINLIREKMDYIDYISDTCYNGEERTVTEYHDLTKFKGGIWFGVGIPVFLSKCYVKRIDSLLLFNGLEWEEWVGNRVEKRLQGDYWVDYHEGILFINRFLFLQAGKEVKVTYTYGRDDLPAFVKELCRLLVVRDLLINERRLFAVPESEMSLRIGEQLNWIEKRILELEEMVRAIKMPKVRTY